MKNLVRIILSVLIFIVEIQYFINHFLPNIDNVKYYLIGLIIRVILYALLFAGIDYLFGKIKIR